MSPKTGEDLKDGLEKSNEKRNGKVKKLYGKVIKNQSEANGSDMVQVNFTCTKDMVGAIEEAAAQDGRDKSGWMRRALDLQLRFERPMLLSEKLDRLFDRVEQLDSDQFQR